MRELPAALQAMGAYRQFIVYKSEASRTRPGKTDKYPADFRTGRVVSAHKPAYWTDAATAIAAAATLGSTYGVGFTFTESDPFFFVDLDDCLLPSNEWSPEALEICGAFAGAAIERSISGKGLHIFGIGCPPVHRCESPFKIGGFYHTDRFVALTGDGIVGNCAKDCSAVLPAVISKYWAPDPSQGAESNWTDAPVAEWRGPKDDDELIRRALQSRSTGSAFGHKASFADLWNANITALSAAYPDDGRGYNASQADAALAQHLSFWTGNDCERILRLMGRSGLARDKWEREDYMTRTILGAVGRQFEILTDREPEPVASVGESLPPSDNTPRPVAVSGSTFVGNAEQVELFAGCVYVQDIHRVLVPGGQLLKSEQFKVAYGGYTFTLDNANEKTTRDAWEAFTQSQTFRCPRANAPCFRPDLSPGAIIERGGVTYVNTYWPVNVPRKHGDPAPFLAHLRKVLPDERDRLVLLSYMAACVQHKGVKFQWAPLLQGVEGNGKTLFTRCVAEAVGRRYVHWPKASKLTAQFNGWMVGKIFYGVEDIYVPESRLEVLEELKPMITGGDGLEIEAKGVDQISADICGNFILNSNHKDALRKTRNDRRFCMLFCAQQQVGDLERDGMTGDYFPSIYEWLNADGYAIVSELLHTWPIPDEFNPATKCQRAPVTSATEAAISASTGGVEQEIHEAIAQGLPGFCGGWISSIQLDRLLDRLGVARRVTHSKRREMLTEMGYVSHPALPDGRVNNLILPDAGKPRLFIYKDSPARHIASAAEAAKAYEAANNLVRAPFPI